jgi:hypothetical protein
MITIIIDKSNLKIVSWYEGTSNQPLFGGDWKDPLKFKHIEYNGSMDTSLIVEKDNDDNITINLNIQAQRNKKLEILREKRNQKLSEVDNMINDFIVGDREDIQAIKFYRQTLKDITNNYKEEDIVGNNNLDSFKIDLSDFVWPIKP